MVLEPDESMAITCVFITIGFVAFFLAAFSYLIVSLPATDDVATLVACPLPMLTHANGIYFHHP